MRIIFGKNYSELEEHAKKTIEALEDDDWKHPGRIIPKGVAYHTARYPIVCEDCGETYWSKDQWSRHIKCEKDKKELGFN